MRPARILLFIVMVFTLLACLSVFYPQPGIEVCGLTLRFASPQRALGPSHRSGATAADRLREVEATMHAHVDSAALADSLREADTLRYYTDFFERSPARISCPGNDHTFFDAFFDRLDNARTRPVDIFHYGDSQIEGDRISGSLRRRLQSRFGGNGPGVVPAVQLIPQAGFVQTASDTLTSFFGGGMMGRRSPTRRYGVVAQQVAFDSPSDTVRLSFATRHGRGFRHVTLFAGCVDSSLRAHLTTDAGSMGRRSLGTATRLQTMTWSWDRPATRFDIDLCGRAEIYGLSIDVGRGVSLTNVPLRGSDGTFFTRMDAENLRSMFDCFDVGMLILEFGGNALPILSDTADVERYCQGFGRQIDLMHRLCPEATILVIGPADMSVKVDGELQTHPLLEPLIDRMREVTLEGGAAFWNMYEVMGGRNSMPVWVDNKPAWAAPDYIHFTSKGAARIADVLWQTLMMYYDYKSLKNVSGNNHQACD